MQVPGARDEQDQTQTETPTSPTAHRGYGGTGPSGSEIRTFQIVEASWWAAKVMLSKSAATGAEQQDHAKRHRADQQRQAAAARSQYAKRTRCETPDVDGPS
jgi:hypothetical protein